jgi:hypothetical protein
MVDNLHQLITTAGNRRAVLAALVSAAASGVAPVAVGVSLARNGKKNQNKSKKKKNQKGSGDPSLPNLRYVQSEKLFDAAGLVSGSAQCPAGFFPVGAGFAVSQTGIVSSLTATDLDSVGRGCHLQVNVTAPESEASLLVECACLQANNVR